ncbi:MAG: ATP-binding protein, partial [Candidatus Falkowbacteria bacterium]|nr:ATP-binding protein [Candidatus Falkowbacteria bacterium]
KTYFNKIYTLVFLFLFTVVSLSSFFGNFIIQGIEERDGVNSLIYNYGNLGYGLYLLTCFSVGFVFILRKYKRATGFFKLQLVYVFFGVLISLVIGFVNNFVLTYLGDFRYNWVGPVSTLVMVACIAYAIIRYRLMGIRLILSRIYVYSLVGVYTYIVYFVVMYVGDNFLGGLYDVRFLLLSIFCSFAYAIGLIPLLNKVQASSDVLFYRGYNPQRIFKDLGLRLSSVIELKSVLNILAGEFKKILAVDEINVLLFKNTKNKITCLPVFGELKSKKNLFKEQTIDFLANSQKILTVDELKEAGNIVLAKELVKRNIEIVAPLIVRSKVVGVILLGEKISQDAYTQEDFDFLEVISSQAAVAIDNARLYKEVADYNKNLEKKVAAQTKDINNKQEKLQRLLNMRSEFLDITSHQLRTPVSVIKGVISMLDEGSVPKNKVKEFMKMAFDKSLKLEQIVDEILRASEMDSEKFVLNLSPVDIIPLVKEIYEEKVPIARKNGIDLQLILPKVQTIKVMSDLKYIKHVIINLVNNALQYAPKGKISVIVKQLSGKMILDVEDNGIGIPKSDIPKLYTKFSRANNAKETFVDGSGLGLYIIKQIIAAHKGASVKILKTEVGKGTTMRVSLPLLK